MTTGNPRLFHTTRSLQEALESAFKQSLPQGALLPLRDALLPAIHSAIHLAGEKRQDPRNTFAAMQTELEDWKRLLDDLQTTASDWYVFEELQARFNDSWWAGQLAALEAKFKENHQDGARLWLELFASALVEWDLPGCARMTAHEFPFPESLAYVPLMFQSGVAGLQNGQPAEAGDMLAFLSEPLGLEPPPQIDPKVQALIIFLQGRISEAAGDLEQAADQYTRAAGMLPLDGLPQTGLAWLKKRQGSEEEAAALFKQACSLSPDQPEGYTGLAMLLDDQSAWSEAEEWYRRAVDCALRKPNPLRAVERLLAPTSGNLYFHLAEALKDISLAAALDAVEKALAASLKNASAYPDVAAYALKGDLLRERRKKSDAAQAYYEAGRRAGWNGNFEQAVKLLKKAERLEKKSQEIYLSLSENLRMHSYDLAGQAEKDRMIAESLKAWETGDRLGGYTAENSWALLSRALINEIRPERNTVGLGLADLYDWEALYYIERALLLNERDVYAWTFLGRYYRFLNMRSCYRYALDRALEIRPDDVGLLEERTIMSANDGEYEQAKKLVNRLLKTEAYASASWARSVYGFALSRLGKYAEALKYAEVPSEFDWVYFYRALCFIRLDQPEKAVQEYETVWKKTVEGPKRQPLSSGQAGFFIALIAPERREMLNQAITLLEETLDDQTDLFNPRFYLGCARLCRGDDPQAARELMRQAVMETTIANELAQAAGLFLPDMIKFSAALPHAEQVTAVFKEIQALAAEQAQKLQQRPLKAEEEFTERRKRLEEGEFANVPAELLERGRIGARAADARFELHAGRILEAAEIYADLLANHNENLPEASQGLERATQGIHTEAVSMLGKGNRYAAALKLLHKTHQFMLQQKREENLPEVKSQIALAYLGLSERRKDSAASAAGAILEAWEALNEQSEADGWRQVADHLRKPITSMRQYWQIDRALRGIAAAAKPGRAGPDEQLAGGVELILQRMDEFLAEKYRVDSLYLDRPPIYIIRVEIGDGIAPPDTSSQWEMITRYVPQVRSRLNAEFGAEIPGVFFNLVPGILSPGQYRLWINLKVAGQGSIPSGMDPTEALADILYRELRMHFAPFMTFQNTLRLIQTWQKASPEYYLLVSRTLPDDSTKRELGLALRSLAREQVPTNRPGEILPALRDLRIERDGRLELVRKLRLALAGSLPGLEPDRRQVELPVELENELESYWKVVEGEPLLVLPKEAAERLQGAVEQLGGDVIICRSPQLRPALRRLIEARLPHVPVLSEEERRAAANPAGGEA